MNTYQQSMLRDGALEDKVILVTGGGSGLGKSMATYFSELGAKLIITSRNQEKIAGAAKDIQTMTGNEVLHIAGDVRDYESVQNVVHTSIEHFGHIDGLVNNAAGNFISPTERLSHRAFEAIIGIVLNGTVNFSLECGKHWIEQKIPGVMLNIVTTYAWTGSGYTAPSAAAKAGVLALTRSLAVEWGLKYKIRANAIAPGPFPTEGAWTRLFPEELVGQFYDYKKRIPMGRDGHHQELANLAAYLMSDYSNFVNGEVVTIDGGEWLNSGGQFNALHAIPEQMWDMISAATRKGK